MALTTTLSIEIITALTKTLDLSVSPEARINLKKAIALASGTGLNQADQVWHDQRTITASATDTLDVATGGGLVNALGDAIALARLKFLYVFAATANTNNVNVQRPASNGVPLFLAASDAIPVRPGGAFMWVAPDATGVVVTAATGDLIDFVNSAGGTSVVYDVVLGGATA